MRTSGLRTLLTGLARMPEERTRWAAVLVVVEASGQGAVTPSISLTELLGYHLLLVSAVLVMRVLFSASRPRRP